MLHNKPNRPVTHTNSQIQIFSISTQQIKFMSFNQLHQKKKNFDKIKKKRFLTFTDVQIDQHAVSEQNSTC